MPPGDELLFDSRLNRCRVVVVVVVVGVVGRSSNEEALERLSLRIVRNLEIRCFGRLGVPRRDVGRLKEPEVVGVRGVEEVGD